MSEPVERVDEQDRVLGVVDRAEAIRRGWLTLPELARAVRQWPFVPDGQLAFGRYLFGLPSGPGASDHGEEGPLRGNPGSGAKRR
ncbi:hypothetical protein [Kitasatospora sp. NPDC058190]|uniref:hypothetical protein n=1 Tax=Kitasatospora sp. NPDC058190 TaxID=3346371 RepID=UPI0036D8B390